MEVLGSAATIVQLVSFTADVLALGYGYLAKAKRAPLEVKSLMREVTYLNELLEQLEELATEHGAGPVKKAIEKMEDLGTFEDCKRMVIVVEECVKRCQQIEGQGVRNIGRRLVWPFRDKNAKGTLVQLGRLRDTLSAAAQVDSSKTLSRLEEIAKSVDRNGIKALERITTLQEDLMDLKLTTNSIVEELAFVKSTQEEEIIHNQRDDIRRWLRLEGIEYEARYQEALSQRQAATGSWILNSSSFIEWSLDTSTLLWLYGIAGCGKTVLAATIIDHLYQSTSPSNIHATLYFFCDYREPRKRSFHDLLCVLLKQLLDQNEECFADVKSLRKEKMSKTSSVTKPLSNAEHIDLIQRLCNRWKSVRLIIDAVDECADLGTFVPGLIALVANSNINLLLTSRHDVDLVRAIEPIAKYRVPVVENMRDDIHQYLVTQARKRISEGSLKLRDKSLEDFIIKELEQKADGLILIAKLHLDYICRLKSDRAIKEALIKLPSDIYRTYDRILLQICTQRPGDVEDMRRMLQWLLYAMVPLTLEQLGEVIAIRPEDTKLDKSGIATDLLDLAASIGSLVSLNEQETSGKEYEDLRGPKVTLIVLAHSSVEAYLKSGDMAPELAERFYMSAETAQASLARTCLKYVAFNDFVHPISLESPVATPATYANLGRGREKSRERVIGARTASDHLWPQTKEDVSSPSPSPPRQSPVRKPSSPDTLRPIAFNAPSRLNFSPLRSFEPSPERTSPKTTSLELLRCERLRLRARTSIFAFYDYACRYWPDHLQKSNLSSLLDVQTINLLDWFVDFRNHEGKYVSWQQMYHHDIVYYCPGRPPLYYAIDWTIESLVALLKPPRSEINNLICGVSPLHVAARCGAVSIVQMLLEEGASVDLRTAKDPTGMASLMTPLHFAAEGGHAEVIKLLLQHGASPHVKNEGGGTPFLRAARSGSIRALAALYEAGSDLNTQKKGFTPLYEAVAQCRPRIACQLLQWGADPTILTYKRDSALALLQRTQNEAVLKDYWGHDRVAVDSTSKGISKAWATEDSIYEQIQEIRAKNTPGGHGFMPLLKGLKREWVVLKQMEKDTRPGTEREKDSRYYLDTSRIVTIAELLDKEDDTLTGD